MHLCSIILKFRDRFNYTQTHTHTHTRTPWSTGVGLLYDEQDRVKGKELVMRADVGEGPSLG